MKRKILAIFLSLLMAFSAFSMAVVPAAATEEPELLAQYFSTDDPWYDTVTDNGSALEWQTGKTLTYNENLGMTYFDDTYARIANEDLFRNVTGTDGLTFAFTYRWDLESTTQHRHILSIGKNASNNIANHFYISGTSTWMSDGHFPMVGWVNGSNGEAINAYPQETTFVSGKTYNIVVRVDATEGIVFFVNGVRQTTEYYGSNLADQLGNIQAFLNEVNGYTENYIGISRWGDGNITGYLSDMRIYGSSMTDDAIYELYQAQPGQYTFRVRFTKTSNSGTSNAAAAISVAHKSENGTGSSTPTKWVFGYDAKSEGDNQFIFESSEWISNDFITDGFPTSISLWLRSRTNNHTVKGTAILEIKDSSGNYTEIAKVDNSQQRSIIGTGGSGSQNKNVDTSLYPHVDSISEIEGADTITLGVDDETKTETYTVAAKDQYGVSWVSSDWTVDGAESNVNGMSNTVTFSKPENGEDYDVTLTATVGGVEKTKTVHVTVEKAAPEADWSAYDEFLENHKDIGTCYTAETLDAYNTALEDAAALKAEFDADDDQSADKWQDKIDAAVAKLETTYAALAEEHTYGNWTYKDDETHTRDCTECGNTETAKHTGGEATCVASAVCDDCKTAYGAVDSNNHKNTELQGKVDADCGNDGYTGDLVCSDCKETVEKGTTISATEAHDWEETGWTTAPTCVADGTKHYVCSVCKQEKDEPVADSKDTVNGHDWDMDNGETTKEPTETENGTIEYPCKNGCGQKKEVSIPVLGHTHSYESKTVVAEQKATCVAQGFVEYSCDNGCEETLRVTLEVDPNNHVGETEVKGAYDATCTAAGYTGDTYCTSCNEKTKDGEETKALGHVDTDGDGYCDRDNVQMATPEPQVCPYCGKVHTGVFAPLVQFFHYIFYLFMVLFGLA